jgi:hypothetical protein
MKNFYDILGISDSASQSEVTNAFRKLAKQYHPDRNPKTRDKFIEIFEAYEILRKTKGNERKHNFRTNNKKRRTEQNSSDSTELTHYWTEDIRSEAEKHANMSYDDFIKSSIIKGVSGVKIFFSIMAHIFILFWAVSILFGFTYGAVICTLSLFGLGDGLGEGFLFNLYGSLLGGLMSYAGWALILQSIWENRNSKWKYIKSIFTDIWEAIKEGKNDNEILVLGLIFSGFVTIIALTVFKSFN